MSTLTRFIILFPHFIALFFLNIHNIYPMRRSSEENQCWLYKGSLHSTWSLWQMRERVGEMKRRILLATDNPSPPPVVTIYEAESRGFMRSPILYRYNCIQEAVVIVFLECSISFKYSWILTIKWVSFLTLTLSFPSLFLFHPRPLPTLHAPSL